MKKELILNSKDSSLSIREQCDLLDLARSTLYYKPAGEKPENLEIMRLMDRHILEEPTAGVLTMKSMLKDNGIKAGYERVRRLMHRANIRAIYPRPLLTVLGQRKYIFPYLLRNLKINHPNHVWEIDITYIPMKKGFMYLTAIIDVYSRAIMGWGVSNTLDAQASLEVVKQAIKTHGNPEILNSDQGSQFTCSQYTELLEKEGIQISMDGKGRALDNIYIERFWRTIKYQHVYLNPAEDGVSLYLGIKKWLERYHSRGHQGLGDRKPMKVYQNAA